MPDIDELCVLTHPLGSVSESHARTLLNVLSTITTVSLVAVSIDEASSLREEYETVSIADETTTESIPLAAVGFLLNQLRMARVIRRRPRADSAAFRRYVLSDTGSGGDGCGQEGDLAAAW